MQTGGIGSPAESDRIWEQCTKRHEISLFRGGKIVLSARWDLQSGSQQAKTRARHWPALWLGQGSRYPGTAHPGQQLSLPCLSVSPLFFFYPRIGIPAKEVLGPTFLAGHRCYCPARNNQTLLIAVADVAPEHYLAHPPTLADSPFLPDDLAGGCGEARAVRRLQGWRQPLKTGGAVWFVYIQRRRHVIPRGQRRHALRHRVLAHQSTSACWGTSPLQACFHAPVRSRFFLR